MVSGVVSGGVPGGVLWRRVVVRAGGRGAGLSGVPGVVLGGVPGAVFAEAGGVVFAGASRLGLVVGFGWWGSWWVGGWVGGRCWVLVMTLCMGPRFVGPVDTGE